MPGQPRRNPGEENPQGSSAAADDIAREAWMAPGAGVSRSGPGLLGLVDRRRARRAKRRAIAAWEAERAARGDEPR